MPNTEPEVAVSAAVIEDAAGRVLLAQRPEGGHLPGLWEFPGGKIEPGETAEAALRRELDEELGVSLTGSRPLLCVRHRYPGRSVRLEVFRAVVDGNPHGREGQALAWVGPDAFDDYPMPDADRPVVNALRLPPLYRFTPPDVDRDRLLALITALPDTAPALVQFRVFGPDRAARRALAVVALERCRERGLSMLVNADAGLAADIGADGVHLNSRQLHACGKRPLSSDHWCAASCHNADDLVRARTLGLDFVVLSPVRPTPGHPHAEPLGWPAFEVLARDAGLPVYALGGMRLADLDTARQWGAQGVAGIRGLWHEAG